MARRGSPSWPLILLSVAVLGAYLWWGMSNNADSPRVQDPSSNSSSKSGSNSGSSGRDPESGLGWVKAESLPPEARETLALIEDGGPFPYREDGGVFGNFERILPRNDRGYYHEYTVDTPGLDHRGARRIVTGSQGEFYWTSDHYESFERIRR